MKRTHEDEMILKRYHEMTGNERVMWDLIFALTEEERELFLDVVDLVIDNPARQEVALSWKGKMKDLPAALAEI